MQKKASIKLTLLFQKYWEHHKHQQVGVSLERRHCKVRGRDGYLRHTSTVITRFVRDPHQILTEYHPSKCCKQKKEANHSASCTSIVAVKSRLTYIVRECVLLDVSADPITYIGNPRKQCSLGRAILLCTTSRCCFRD